MADEADPVGDLFIACVSYVGTQRRLLDGLIAADLRHPAVHAMTAELDQLATAVRHAQRHLVARERGDPGS